MSHRILIAIAGLLVPLSVLAQQPVISGEFVFTERRGASSAFGESFDFVIGATSITPAGPTTAQAIRLGGGGPDYALSFVTGVQFPAQYAVRTAYTGQSGQWTISATNSGLTSARNTHVLDDIRTLPFLTGVTLSGPELAPRVTWNPVDHLVFPGFCTSGGPGISGAPSCGLGTDIFNYQVEVREVTGTPGNAVPLHFTSATIPTARLVGGFLTPSDTFFDIPTGVLSAGHEYIFGVRFTHLDQETVNPNGSGLFFAENRSATYAVAPIPEPETYAMLLAGLLLLGFEARRRAKAVRAS